MCIKRCWHTCTDSAFPFDNRQQEREREEADFSVYKNKSFYIILCCKYELLVVLRRFHSVQ